MGGTATLTLWVHQDDLSLTGASDGNVETIGVIGKIRTLRADHVEKDEVCLATLTSIDGASLATGLDIQSGLPILRQSLDSLLVPGVRALVRTDDKNCAAFVLVDLPKHRITQKFLNALHDPFDVQGVVPARDLSHFATISVVYNETRLTTHLAGWKKALEETLNVSYGRRVQILLRVSRNHLLGIEHLRGKLLQSTVCPVIDQKAACDGANSIGTFHHRDEHLRRPLVVASVVRSHEGSGLTVILV